MKFAKPENSNYCATVVKIKNIIQLENCDNVVATNIFGFQAIVNKETTIETLGVVFPVETQLSERFCSENNLFRHAEKNKDQTQKGYLEDKRRIKAVKFRGNRSDALFMPLTSFSYLGLSPEDFKEGDEFDAIDGEEICRKYVVPVRFSGRANSQPKPKMFTRVDTKFIPEHFSTDNYFKNDRNIDPEQEIIVTQKLHGTSIRIANTIVRRKKSLLERFVEKLGVKVQEHEYDYVFGSRKVIKDINNPNHNHYYKEDLWSREGKKLEGLVPENFIIYAELIGWTEGGGAIQAGYTYKIPAGQAELYIYRVAFVNEKGMVVDLTWDQVREFCFLRNLKTVPEIFRGKHKDFVVNNYLDKELYTEHFGCCPVEEKTIDEGVCIRVDNRITPYILKAKSPKFFEYETTLLDQGVVDMESMVEEITT